MNAKIGVTYQKYAKEFLEGLRDEFDQAFKDGKKDKQERILKRAEMHNPNHEITIGMRKDYDFEFND